MPRRSNLAAALQGAAGYSQSVSQPIEKERERQAPEAIRSDKVALPPSRQGKKAITGYFDPAVSRQLKQIMVDEDTTMQALLTEALNDLFGKYGKKPIA
jgi:hypothetical protein